MLESGRVYSPHGIEGATQAGVVGGGDTGVGGWGFSGRIVFDEAIQRGAGISQFDARCAGAGVRAVTLDLDWKPVDVATVVESLKAARGDFVLLQGVSRKDAQAIGDALGMRHGGQLQMIYSPGNSDDPNRPGNAILGRHALFKGRVMQRKKADSMGVVGEAVVGGKRFMLVSVDLGGVWVDGDAEVKEELEGLNATWEAAKEPPMIAGGDFAGNSEGARLSPRLFGQQRGAFVVSGGWGEVGTEELAGGVRVVETRAGN